MNMANLGWKSVWSASTFISARTMLIRFTVGLEKDAGSKNIIRKGMIKILEKMEAEHEQTKT